MDAEILRTLALRRDQERGPGTQLTREAPVSVALVYPSPYRVGMSSLGFLQMHRLINRRRQSTAERAFLPDPSELILHHKSRSPLLTVERQRRVGEFDIIAISHAYELELTGIAEVLSLAGVDPLARARGPQDPLVILGGPITFSNPRPSAPFADVILLGEAEETIGMLMDRIEADPGAARGNGEARAQLLRELSDLPGFYVPSIHADFLPPIAQAPDERLPAFSEIWTPNTELSNMLLIEPERGCHRGCTFCVMRRSTNGGMRLVQPADVLRHVPDDVPKVGLVGAAVTDHPKIKTILRELIEGSGKRVGISSLRADRLDQEFVELLAAGGYRSMTVALDAASTRLRDVIEKNLKDRHVLRAAELARSVKMRHLKIYVIVGLPGETEEDREELAQFALQLQKTIPVVLGVSPFIPKFHTPLADEPFAGEKNVAEMLRTLKRRLAGKVEVRGPGAREAYVEYRLSQGGLAHGEAAVQVAADGAKLSSWKKALSTLPETGRPENFVRLIPPPTRRRRGRPPAAIDPV